MRLQHTRAVAALSLLALTGCGNGTGSTTTTSKPTDPPPFPQKWASAIDNPLLPLVPGTRWVYRSTSEDGNQRIVVTVTDQGKTVNGVAATVVHDRVTKADGTLVEDTFDWYAQDAEGNVWYLGEDTKAYDGTKVSTEGSWEAGVDGARAGIVMLAHPQPGDAYQQEYYAGEAEDRARVLRTDASVTVPVGSWSDVVQTEDSTPLEPDLLEHKFYAPGIGVVEERDVSGGDEHVVLVQLVQP